MTLLLFQDDACLTPTEAVVTAINEAGGLLLDQTIYPTGGGPPGDTGWRTTTDGTEIALVTAVKGEPPDEIVPVTADRSRVPDIGSPGEIEIDWTPRHRHMRMQNWRVQNWRMQNCLPLLSAVLPCPVTGGHLSDGTGRRVSLIFDDSHTG